MEEKILAILTQMNQKFDNVDKKFDGIYKEFDNINNKFDGIYKEFDNINNKFDGIYKEFDNINNKFDAIHKEFEHVFKEMDNLRKDVKQDISDFEKRILDRQFLFEEEYGKKIDAIFEFVQFHQKTNLQRFDKINDLEKRVSALERKSV